MRVAILFCLFALVACESGLTEEYFFNLPESVTAAWSPEAPGLLRVENGYGIAVKVLCGQRYKDPVRYVKDLGFGCLGDQKGTQVEVVAWVEPAPESWSAVDLCVLKSYRNDEYIAADAQVTGSDHQPASDELAESPEPDWVQATGKGTWKRDASPCGGWLRVKVRFPELLD